MDRTSFDTTAIETTQLGQLLLRVAGTAKTQQLFAMIEVDPRLLGPTSNQVSRAVLAQAMNMMLFAQNLSAVPEGARYVAEKLAAGCKVVFDHGALRTVDAARTGALPHGQQAFKRILEPLGFAVAHVYPLKKLKMTGRAYCHLDLPEVISQFFVSELHVDQFSINFQVAAERIVHKSRDPLGPQHHSLLVQLASQKELSFDDAAVLLPALVGCFDVQHEAPHLVDYETVLAESAEMAWISTEGNRFNHATDRVPHVIELADELRAKGYPIKDSVEISGSGAVRQTALKAAMVQRVFLDEKNHPITRTVPGSFYEFISRDKLPDSEQLDLRFDASNAQGIFKMTAAS
ncbi:DUF1338 domain-containing protein [Iodobacter sp. CM08]|uniref:DUF1338 domain-containing protein n=1 Tax=Iodobacter sp. CM08 TaxID=3085902 RepID=UPI002980CC82|nr:DUF1338 domain-containing protein [Iodobacter sp. CM08]MDW5417974.1 DUF1338 domain-containing protein [Iodobacter sp. CM08]